MFTLPSLKKNVKDKKKKEGLKDAFYLWEKEQRLAMFLFSVPVLEQRAWFSGKPGPQPNKNKPCSFS